MKTFVFFLILFIIVGSFGCSNNHIVSQLENADSLMEEYPDSSLNILESINPKEIKSRKNTAYYALLLTQAREKTNTDLTSDSLINIAQAYYRNHGSKFNRLRTAFYAGRLAYYRGEYARAMLDATEAYEEAEKYGDPYWIAKSAELMADIYSKNFNKLKALEFFLLTVKNYEKAGREDNLRFSWCDVAYEYMGTGDVSRGIQLADSIFRLAIKENNNTNLIDYSFSFLFTMLNDKQDWVRVKELYVEFPELIKGNLTEDELTTLNLFMNYTDTDDKKKIDSLMTNLPADIRVVRDLTRYFYMRGDYEKSQRLTDTLLDRQNKKIREVLNLTVLESEKNYYKEQAVVAEMEKREQRIQLYIIITFIVVITIVVFFFFRYRIKSKNLRIKDSMAEIYVLNNRIELLEGKEAVNREKAAKSNERIIDLEKRIKDFSERENKRPVKNPPSLETTTNPVIRELFQGNWKLLNTLCNDFFEDNSTEQDRKSLIKLFDRQIKILKGKKSIEELEKNINLHFNDAMNRLKKQCGFLNENELTLVIFMIAGFSPRTFNYIFGINSNTFYSRRKRIIQKIKESDAQDKTEFLELLGK